MRMLSLAVASVALLACGDDTTSPPLAKPPDVLIVNGAATMGSSAYSPNPFTISISVKQSVKWRDNDPTGPKHTITADLGEFASDSLRDGETFTHTFTNIGTYDYHCEVHPTMVGTIIVNP